MFFGDESRGVTRILALYSRHRTVTGLLDPTRAPTEHVPAAHLHGIVPLTAQLLVVSIGDSPLALALNLVCRAQ